MKKGWVLVAALCVIIIIGLILLLAIPTPRAQAPAPVVTNTPVATTTQNEFPSAGIPDLISVGNPAPNQHVTSPLTVTGSARGTWYFEASFPVELLDASGKSIATGHGQAQSDWMTQDFVIFKADITFPKQPAGSKGTLVLKKDNPSGDPSRDKKLEVPVTF